MRKFLLLFIIIFCSCKPTKLEKVSNSNNLEEYKGVIGRVVHLPDEQKITSINRWLWNLMTFKTMTYDRQLKATELYLLINEHIKCRPLNGVTYEDN